MPENREVIRSAGKVSVWAIWHIYAGKRIRSCGGLMFRAQKAGKGRRTEPSPEVFIDI